MLVCGIPLYFLEIMTSQFSGKGTWRVWDLSSMFRGLGISFLVINWIVATYLMLQKPWIIEYIVDSCSTELPWTSFGNEWNTPGCAQSGHSVDYSITNSDFTYNYSTGQSSNFTPNNWKAGVENDTSITHMTSVEEFLNYKILEMSSGIDDIGRLNWKYLLYLLVCHVIIWLSLPRSVHSIGKRFVSLLKPSVEWKPSEQSRIPVFQKSERGYKRSIRRLALFNLTGRGGCDKLPMKFGGDSTEMDAINRNIHV